MSYLVIVESPAKANTIKGYLGSKYKVVASKGHIRDLPKSTLGIDVDNGFKPHYINIRGKGDVIKDLKREAKGASKIFLATDPDREGEAISWHIAKELGIPEDEECRITFNETTKGAVKESIKHPRRINIDLVNSQQARRILDRVVGFKLSELLWKNVKSGLSGGRVQSVAARIITEREEEIKRFVPEEYWTVDANLLTNNNEEIDVKLFGNENGKIKISCSDEAKKVENLCLAGEYTVHSVKRSKKRKMPSPPFITSTLQQEASKKLGFQSQRIMKVAQELYEGLNLGSELGGTQGLITYMRTDSLRVSGVAQDMALDFIRQNYGEEYVPQTTRVYRSGSSAQDAHEAIRPTNVFLTPKLVKGCISQDQYKIYKLIWERFVASQMESSVLDTVTVEIENSGLIFRTGGYTIKSLGYLAVYQDELDSSFTDGEEIRAATLPYVKRGDKLRLKSLNSTKHFTEAPPRYTEATLIKFLEENGIGRPSTYAPTISILTDRKYVCRDNKSLVATTLGEVTVNYMKENFPEIIDYEFTASMESQLDAIAQGKNSIEGVLTGFWNRFQVELDAAKVATDVVKKTAVLTEESEYDCSKCGAKLIYKDGKFGRFLACSNFPACKNTVTLDKDGKPLIKKEINLDKAGFCCEICGADMVIRNGRYGTFYACSNYPACKNTKQKTTDIGVKCPKCGDKIVAKRGRGRMLFYSCNQYPKCDFSSWDMPLNENCPKCNDVLYYRKSKKNVICKNPTCDYKREEEMTVID